MVDIGKSLIFIGIVFILLGIFFYLLSSESFRFLNFLGRLPGDINIEKENFKFYFPITTSILLSLLLSLLFYLISKLR
jgi:hypothetical protein